MIKFRAAREDEGLGDLGANFLEPDSLDLYDQLNSLGRVFGTKN